MKKGIHPEYHKDAKVACACGNNFETGSTQEKIEVELCSNCHPFYTGKQKLVDTARRVEKFQEKVAAKDKLGSKSISKKAKRAAKDKRKQEKNED